MILFNIRSRIEIVKKRTDLLNKLHVGKQGNERHEIGVGNIGSSFCNQEYLIIH